MRDRHFRLTIASLIILAVALPTARGVPASPARPAPAATVPIARPIAARTLRADLPATPGSVKAEPWSEPAESDPDDTDDLSADAAFIGTLHDGDGPAIARLDRAEPPLRGPIATASHTAPLLSGPRPPRAA